MASILKTMLFFVLAAGSEISGAYLIWQWQRSGRSALAALLGLGLLFGYALIQTAQAFSFGRAFAAYGAVFIASALLWGWWIDGQAPDRWDVAGVLLCLFGAAIMLWMPRSG